MQGGQSRLERGVCRRLPLSKKHRQAWFRMRPIFRLPRNKSIGYYL
jgi:hypothetical protein